MGSINKLIEDLERKAFDQWYAENAFDFAKNPIGSRECGLQWSAWKARAAMNSKCRGVAHPRCNYMDACGSVCNKCGQQV